MNHRSRKRDRGVAAVEFALVVLPFLFLVLGAIDFGYYLFVSEVVTNAAREGARAGAVAAASDRETNARDKAVAYLTGGGLDDPPEPVVPPPSTGTDCSVSVTARYKVGENGAVTGFFSVLPDYAEATAVMRCE